METVILIITAIVVLAAVVWICLFLKMIITKDFSLLTGEPQLAQSQRVGARRSDVETPKGVPVIGTPMEQIPSVAAFAKDLAESRTAEGRRKTAERFRAMRKRRFP